MKIFVANKDRTDDLGADIRAAAQVLMRGGEREVPAKIPPEISALSLALAKSDAEYLDNLIRLIRYRDAVDTLDFIIPRKAGLAGLIMSRIKAFLWQLLRYQHDRITFRQNLINTQLTGALAFEVAARQKEITELKRRVAELEKQSGNRE
ncbi:MAG: hypothetical protein KKG09_05580 [Verrucomicrobia bacterium]|nr:hypothetical protein [Verrucomicrobiota bacterium]MCG2681656.1 hypothetical protein [Kiritimatiellia bacterium]MBU4248108.1 hypothetical protein [Verrucomicrobiota bacterium]MBU4290784.1 hypothetical protein [Verrucomicrobiota bacterium]MBU4429741.1 hypothetical protein [Verrucomicrobiota bacterium]